MQRDYEFTAARNLNNLLDAEYIGQKSAQKTIARLGAKQLATGNTKVLFTSAVAAQLFNYLTMALYGSKIATQSSFLLDKLNTKLLPDFITLIDQPLLKMGLNSCCFDSDGVATKQLDIVTNGKLNTYLLDNYFAKKLNLQTTGHADGIHNLFIQNTNHDKLGLNLASLKNIYGTIKNNCHIDLFVDCAELIKIMQTGLIVTDTIGHGVNLVTGDYSKGACGFWVENGKIAYPVEEITIAGNLLTMFNNILATGQDYNYQNHIITGSVLIDNMTIAGQ
jgi:PmbA protein